MAQACTLIRLISDHQSTITVRIKHPSSTWLIPNRPGKPFPVPGIKPIARYRKHEPL
jgi:hypothetical protein